MLILLFFAILFIFLFVITTFKPGVGLVGAICIYGLEQWAQTQSATFIKYGAAINYIMGVVILYALVVMMLHNRNPFKNFPAVGWWIWGLMIFSYMSYFWTVSSEDTMRRMTNSLPYLLAYTFLTPLIIVHPRDLKDGFMATLLLGSLILIGIVFGGSYQNRSLVLEGTQKGIGNALALGTLGGRIAIIMVLLRFYGLTRILQLLRWGVVAAALYVLLRSQSRGQFLALLVAVAVFLPLARQINLRSTRAISTLLSLSVFGVLALIFFAAVAYKLNPDRWSMEQMRSAVVDARLGNILLLLGVWLESDPMYWLVGMGTGTFYGVQTYVSYPHNVPAEVLGELGIVGCTMLMIVYYLTLRAIWNLMLWTKEYPFERSVYAALSAMCVFHLILSFKQGSLQGNTGFFMAAIIAGRMESVLRPHMQQSRQTVSVPQVELGTGGAALGTS